MNTEKQSTAPRTPSIIGVQCHREPDWSARRAPECDTAARDVCIDGLLTFILMRHYAWESTVADNPHKPVYLEARDNAIRELKWRIMELWHDNDLRDRMNQRLCETLGSIRDVMKDRAAYEAPVPSARARLIWGTPPSTQ